MSNKKVGRKILKITVTIAEGIDAFNPRDETVIDLNVFDDMKVCSIHAAVLKILQLKDEEK